MPQEFTLPSRNGLILGLALVALECRKKVHALEARYFGYADPRAHAGYHGIEEALATLKRGEELVTDSEEILDLLAHTRQTARVSLEEWEQVVRIKSAP